MLIKVGQKFETWMRKVLPDPLVIAIILTLIVGLLAVIFTPTTPIQVVENWSKGFWELIPFTMQVAFGLIAGAVLAKSPIVNRGMVKLCSLPEKEFSAPFCCVTTLVLWWVNWGIGLIAGAFLAKEMAVQLSKKNVPYHLPLLAAGGYSGIMTSKMGLTGAIPLQIAAARTPVRGIHGRNSAESDAVWQLQPDLHCRRSDSDPAESASDEPEGSEQDDHARSCDCRRGKRA